MEIFAVESSDATTKALGRCHDIAGVMPKLLDAVPRSFREATACENLVEIETGTFEELDCHEFDVARDTMIHGVAEERVKID